MNAQAPNRPLLTVDADPCQPASRGVNVCNIDPDLMVSLGRHLQAGGLPQSILRINVVRTGAPIGDDLPDVFGRYHVLKDGVRFIPHARSSAVLKAAPMLRACATAKGPT